MFINRTFITMMMSFIVILLSCLKMTESCTIIAPPCGSFDIKELFSSLFGGESEPDTTQMKYDRKSESWVEECPEISSCQYGIDDGDCDTCPICRLGPGDECSDWRGKCGDEMICHYPSMFACTGKCMLESEFNSRGIGEKCGPMDGKCTSQLKCRIDQDPWGFFLGSESGSCVTLEQFNSRKEGETCGEKMGNCGDDLKCLPGYYPWDRFTCKAEGEEFSEVCSCSSRDGISVSNKPTLVIESDNDGDIVVRAETEEEKMFPNFFLEEINILEDIIKSEIGNGTTEEIIEIIEIPKDANSSFLELVDEEAKQILSLDTDKETAESLSNPDGANEAFNDNAKSLSASTISFDITEGKDMDINGGSNIKISINQLPAEETSQDEKQNPAKKEKPLPENGHITFDISAEDSNQNVKSEAKVINLIDNEFTDADPSKLLTVYDGM